MGRQILNLERDTRRHLIIRVWKRLVSLLAKSKTSLTQTISNFLGWITFRTKIHPINPSNSILSNIKISIDDSSSGFVWNGRISNPSKCSSSDSVIQSSANLSRRFVTLPREVMLHNII
jgi:hypothetical protein